MAKGVKFGKPPNFAARNPNVGRGTALQRVATPKGSMGAGQSTRGQGAVPKASSGAQPLVAPKTGKGKAMVGRALRGTPKAF